MKKKKLNVTELETQTNETEYKLSIEEIQKLYSQNVKRLHLLQAKKCEFPESGKKEQESF